MKKITLLAFLICFCFSAGAQNLCGGYFYDSGGANGDYQNNEHTITTLRPEIIGETVTARFSGNFVLSSTDVLKIYNGEDTNAPLYQTYTGDGSGNNPGTVTSTSASGCLTFEFTSDGNYVSSGWEAEIFCCSTPKLLTSAYVGNSGDISLGWTDSGTSNQWEIRYYKNTGSSYVFTNLIVDTNPYVLSGLTPGFYSWTVRSLCSPGDTSIWPYSTTFRYEYQSPNDECTNALTLPINRGTACTNITTATIGGATHSDQPVTCSNLTMYDDIWYRFTATDLRHIIKFSDKVSTSPETLIAELYTGECNNLQQLRCTANAVTLDYSQYVPGQTYYLRISQNSDSNRAMRFNICVQTVSSCKYAEAFCGSSVNDPYIFENVTNISSIGAVACLDQTPNPAYFTLKVTQPGPLQYTISQNVRFDEFGEPTSLSGGLDVDFVAWGPFTSADNCNEIVFEDCPTCPFDNTGTGNFYPFGNIIDCSYSKSGEETLSIPHALAGEYYKVLITNYEGTAGFIKLEQTNFSTPGSGRTICADRLQLISFVDTNNNGIKDDNEPNFSFGTFNYQINNAGEIIRASSATGKYIIADPNLSNTYNFSYQINPEYSAYYATAATQYNNVSIIENGGTQFLYFPITVTQPYTDVTVSIIPTGQPIAGMVYTNKIVYKNLGMTPASGTLTFTRPTGLSSGGVTPSGSLSNPTGFTYAYTNLMPFESRAFVAKMNVPAIPAVNIGTVLNSAASITTANDFNADNNTFSNSQIVAASYDPNDIMEIRGNQILITDFDNTDYLYYTIRFENTGTSNAINIKIEDLLDDGLDEQSIRMVDASHDYRMERVDNKIIWSFDGIQLKPTDQSETQSKGHITFRIKPTPGFAVGTIIPNMASIFFDTNPAIITNTFNTEFVDLLGTAHFNSSNFVLYPNPTRKQVQIDLLNTTETISSIEIDDTLGKCIRKINHLNTSQQTLDVSDFAKGIYFLKITTNNNLKQTKKLIIE